VDVGGSDSCRISASAEPVPAPGEVITDEVLDHLCSGVERGVLLPDGGTWVRC
jgi:hypothetical protein